MLQLLDPSLGDNYDHEEMEKMVLAATLCIKRAPRARPQMNLVSGPLLTLLYYGFYVISDIIIDSFVAYEVNFCVFAYLKSCGTYLHSAHLNFIFLFVN